MNKKEIKELKSVQSSNIGLNILNEITQKNTPSQKESHISSNKNISKNKSVSTNQIYTFREETKSNIHNSKKKDKHNSCKKKKKSKDKISKLLKNNEKLKIPTGKRRSIAVNNLKLNLNNFNNILQSLTPPKESYLRTDKNGIEINKNNKKKVHITFLDDISPNNKFTETVNIQSFKQFNIVENESGQQNLSKCSQCCNVF